MSVSQRAAAEPGRLGAGGEAEVFEVPGRPGLAFKRYRRPTAERTAKLRVMLAHPPAVDRAKGAIAWPVEIVSGSGGEAIGFLMPRVDLASYVPLFRVYNPASRHRLAPGISWRFLLRTARNMATVVQAVHEAGCVVGDLNESNLLVDSRALVALVDCDSMQVPDPESGQLHHCPVGKPEYTAPELHRADLATRPRTQASDSFAIAVLVFQLLLEGVHPFSGIWHGRGEPPDIATRIARRRFPYRRTVLSLAPPPVSLDPRVLPQPLRRLIRRTFTIGMLLPSRRPTAAEWAAALERAEHRLTGCPRSPHHEYAAHLRDCPWCVRIDRGLPDPFPGATGRSALVKRPPTLAHRARVGLVAGALKTRSRAVHAAARMVRSPWRSPAAREVMALGAVFAAAAIAPPLVTILATTVLLVTAHSVHQAEQGGRLRHLLATFRRIPANVRAAARAAAIAGLLAAVVTLALAVLSATVRSPALPGADPVDAVRDQLRWGTATWALLMIRWPFAGGRVWTEGVARARARVRTSGRKARPER